MHAAPPLPPIQVSKTDELAASLAAHQEYHLKQADELLHCHAEIRQLEESSEVRGVHHWSPLHGDPVCREEMT